MYEAYVHVNICHSYDVEYYQYFKAPYLPLEDFTVIVLEF